MKEAVKVHLIDMRTAQVQELVSCNSVSELPFVICSLHLDRVKRGA